MKSRMPVIGDMIVRKILSGDRYYTTEERRYIGLVGDIIHDKWGHQKSVLITWSGEAPPDYREEYGYAGVNIHNLRHEFDVIRDGENIP